MSFAIENTEVYITAEQLDAEVTKLAQKINKDYGFADHLIDYDLSEIIHFHRILIKFQTLQD